MKKQQLVELIREKKTEEAIDFAQHRIDSKFKESPKYIEQMEEIMSLLMFEDFSAQDPSEELLKVLEISQRKELASAVNKAILDNN